MMRLGGGEILRCEVGGGECRRLFLVVGVPSKKKKEKKK